MIRRGKEVLRDCLKLNKFYGRFIMNRKIKALLLLTAVMAPAVNAVPSFSEVRESVGSLAGAGLNQVKEHPYITTASSGLLLLLADYSFGDRQSVKDFFSALWKKEFKKALRICKKDKKLGLSVALIIGAPTVAGMKKLYSILKVFINSKLNIQLLDYNNEATDTHVMRGIFGGYFDSEGNRLHVDTVEDSADEGNAGRWLYRAFSEENEERLEFLGKLPQ